MAESKQAKSEKSSSKPKKSGTDSKSQPKARSPKGTKSKSKSSAETYTDPALRDRLKEEITAGDKGGKPGQWSARKAQLLASEYEKAGGDYKNGKKKKTEAQQHLDQWTDEDWKTSDDKPADRDGGTTRYLPAEAWDKLTPAEKKATNAKKQAGSKKGKQFVANTDEAKEARQETTAHEGDKPAAKAKPKAKPKSAAQPRPKARKKSS